MTQKFWEQPIFAKHGRALVAGAVALVVLIAIGVAVGLSKSDWAAWVQAVGSILAITASAVIVLGVVRTQRHSDDVRAAEVICEVASHCDRYTNRVPLGLTTVEKINEAKSSGSVLEAFLADLEAVGAMDIPILQMPPTMVPDYLVMREAIRLLARRLAEDLSDPTPATEDLVTRIRVWYEAASQVTGERKLKLERKRDALKGLTNR